MPRNETVTRVIDGDTLMTKMRKKPVRLPGVDAPEMGKRGGTQAKELLKQMIEGKKVTIDTLARDKYGRAVAKVSMGRKSVNNAIKRNIRK